MRHNLSSPSQFADELRRLAQALVHIAQCTDEEQHSSTPIQSAVPSESSAIPPSVANEIAEIRRLVEKQQSPHTEKEWYEVKEAAAATKFRPYTLRQACNLGRIKPEWRRKHPRTGRWRIHREAIQWIQNHGLPDLDGSAPT